MNFWHNPNQNRLRCCIRIRWPENQICNLIKLYREHPCLWNKDHPSYLDYCERRSAYRSIFEQIKDCIPNVNLIEVIVKLREVRKYYVNELRKLAEANSEGCAYESRYSWFEEIHEFLHAHLHLDEKQDIEQAASGTYSSNYCDETPSRRSPTSLSEACLSSETPKNSQMHLSLEIPSSEQINDSSQLMKTNSRVTERKSCDQFDLFAKGVACRLRRMDPEVAAEVQIEIQRLLTDLDATTVSVSNASGADSSDKDYDCEMILPYSQDKRFMNQESYTNYTI